MPDAFGMSEVVPALIEPSSGIFAGQRLNLVIPSLDFARSFGGVTTALRLMNRPASEFEAVRIIVTHQKRSDFDFSMWPDWIPDDGSCASRSIIAIGDRETRVSLARGDVFLATAWPTATYVRQVMKQQQDLFSEENRRFVYFLQDYEPGFYSWSVQYWYAESTYRNTGDTIAVFNSKRLADFFHSRRVYFGREYVLEPLMHPHLRETWRQTRGCPKERLIYVYARPNILRNGFDLLVDSLRHWAREFPGAEQWSVISFGAPHEDIALSDAVMLRSMGKGSMHRYGEHLARCWSGVSFQFLAHPSYSRLEMADFGAWVITNKIENNDLSDIAPNILCVEEPTPESVAQRLSWCCARYRPGMDAVLPNLPAVFEDREDEFPSATELVNAWCREPT